MNSTLAAGQTTWTTGSTASLRTGTWRAAVPRHIDPPSPCHQACPVHGDIAEWIGQARVGNLAAAWQTLTRHNPFPAVIGRICHHPCELACNRLGVDGALSICKLERFVGDQALDSGWSYAAVAAQRPERIAVVGGGPSGLSAAYQLRRRGYAVTIFEAHPELGGLMRDGIPGYRLPRAVLDAEIARILALGIEVRSGQALRSLQALQAVRAEFDAVYLAIGARRSRRLGQLEYGQPWVMDGADYLARSNRGVPPALGRRVVVVGGGSAAMDAARSARRAGHEVTILALEPEREMPAQREEVVEALEEGIALVDGAMLLGAAAAGAAGVKLDCVRVRLQRARDCAAFTVTQQPGSGFVLEADAIVTSIGQDPELTALGPDFEADGPLLRTDALGATGVDRVWAGGDLASAARFVSEAIALGERAALSIDRRLRSDEGQRGATPPAAGATEPAVTLSTINLHYHPAAKRAIAPHVAVAERLADGGQAQLGLSVRQALDEAARCFSCGTCTHCDNCVTYCPDLAVRRYGARYEVLGDYCKGCGLCVRQCPTGSMKMVQELR
jgi:NADPH-dependent glutamate synthase beta subunit-like oxidoreductase/Pyruvate/2-oxoacid:ferredoxin oxidoreductase delta subunit